MSPARPRSATGPRPCRPAHPARPAGRPRRRRRPGRNSSSAARRGARRSRAAPRPPARRTARSPLQLARTGEPGVVAYSIPRLPAPYGVAGGRKGSETGASTGGRYPAPPGACAPARAARRPTKRTCPTTMASATATQASRGRQDPTPRATAADAAAPPAAAAARGARPVWPALGGATGGWHPYGARCGRRRRVGPGGRAWWPGGRASEVPLVAGVCGPAAVAVVRFGPGHAPSARPFQRRPQPRCPRDRGWRCRPVGAGRQAGGPTCPVRAPGPAGGSGELALVASRRRRSWATTLLWIWQARLSVTPRT